VGEEVWDGDIQRLEDPGTGFKMASPEHEGGNPPVLRRGFQAGEGSYTTHLSVSWG